ncbi:type VI secretion system Vgr family protein [Nannocystis bainbridge]|uniref:Type VI secretion system tip protein TssI/VgrG n=1 Tax=Nannocystis bainbridge TaxID=2995303 RepID=A0ABT5E6L4_9BACT|nr:type VI secretion system tip protein TssI/VgrG [Nannocystis bainbridge]MDC0721499.1 type VI secretion system tip protein TssI/VgrG [Nannocystis bainbridge]
MSSDGLPAILGNRALFTFAVEGCAEELRVVRFTGREALSSLFEFRIELAAATMPLDELVGKPAVLTIEGLHATRHVHGHVCEAGYIGESSSYTLYELTLVPAIWRLQQRSDCRIFQKQTTPQILTRVLEAAGLPRSEFRLDLQAAYAPHDYCVQYRESDLEFVSRLMEDAGIFYYYEHAEDRHVLVMTDRAGSCDPIEGDPTLRFNFEHDREHIDTFRLSEGLRPQRVSLRDRNLHQPDRSMEASEGDGREREVFDYPGGFQEPGAGAPHHGGLKARVRLEALQADRRRGLGTSDSPRLVPGFSFTFSAPARGHLEGDYRLVRVRHRGEQPQALDEGAAGEFSYSNEFECTDKRLPYRPPRQTARPQIRGAQTATVVGPPGEEVHVDEHGRVKVQFHWDRKGQRDDDSSCWVRVGQAWAGNGFGALFIPRVGHEVLVEFLEGDPDRPIVTGSVYTGLNTPPYPLPADKTRSTLKSESTPGGGGYNELRFEDAKGREEIFLHGQRDWSVIIEHDASHQIGHDEARTIANDRSKSVGHDQSESIGHDKTIAVGNDHAETIARDMTLAVGSNLTAAVGANKAESVALASALTIGAVYQVSVGGAMNETVGLGKAEQVGLARSVTVGADSSETIGGGKSVTAADNITATAGNNLVFAGGRHVNVTAGNNLNVAVGKQASVIVADKLTFQCGGATIVVKKNGELSIQADNLDVQARGRITVRGAMIKLN